MKFIKILTAVSEFVHATRGKDRHATCSGGLLVNAPDTAAHVVFILAVLIYRLPAKTQRNSFFPARRQAGDNDHLLTRLSRLAECLLEAA